MVQSKGENMSKTLYLENEKNDKTVASITTTSTDSDILIDTMGCKKINNDLLKDEIIEFKLEKVLKYHYLDSNRFSPLASPTLQEFFNKYAPNDVQFIPYTIITKDNKKVTDYAMINILSEIDGHDKEYTEYNYSNSPKTGKPYVRGINKIKYLNDAMGEHLIRRDKFSHSHIVFSEKFRELLKLEKIKLKDYKYYLPEEWYS
jgi:hypothetical protein